MQKISYNKCPCFIEDVKKITFIGSFNITNESGFSSLPNLVSVEFKDSGKNSSFINYGAFKFCTKLPNIVLEAKIGIINKFSFEGTSFVEITIPQYMQ